MCTFKIFLTYKNELDTIITASPDFEKIELPDSIDDDNGKPPVYTEDFHLDGVDENIKELYRTIKEEVLKIDSNLKFNPQHYYISIRKNKNFAYISIKRKRIRITVLYAESEAKNLIKHHEINYLSQSIKNFWHYDCFEVVIEDKKNLDEIINLLELTYKKHNK